MRRLMAFSTFLILCVAGGADLSACGEKFYLIGRLVKWQQAMAAPVPGAVLLYVNPQSNLPEVLQKTGLAEMLKTAGHTVDSVSEPAALERVLKTGRHQLLLVSAADMARAAQWKADAPAITIVPVLYKAKKADEQAAKGTGSPVVKADKTRDSVLLVNSIIKSLPRARTTP